MINQQPRTWVTLLILTCAPVLCNSCNFFTRKTFFLYASSVLKKIEKKHHRAFDIGQVQTATEHFYIFQDRIQCWMNIFLAFFPETFTSSTMAIQSSITRPYLGPLKAQKKVELRQQEKEAKATLYKSGMLL